VVSEMHLEPALLPTLWTLHIVEVLAVFDVFGVRFVSYFRESVCLGIGGRRMIIE
jgi:hypothetical protein